MASPPCRCRGTSCHESSAYPASCPPNDDTRVVGRPAAGISWSRYTGRPPGARAVVGFPAVVAAAHQRGRDQEVGAGPVARHRDVPHHRQAQQRLDVGVSPSAIRAPICWSPPSGPLRKQVIGRPSSSPSSRPVVPVAQRSCRASSPRLNLAQSRRSAFLWSWAISAIRLRTGSSFLVDVMEFTVRDPGSAAVKSVLSAHDDAAGSWLNPFRLPWRCPRTVGLTNDG